MADLEQRVAAGAALLDRERPGWWETDWLLVRWYPEVRHFYIWWPPSSHSELDRLWLAAIAERRARAESVGPTAEEWAGQR